MKTLNNYILERLNPKNLGFKDTLPKKLKEKYKLIYNPGTGRYDCDDDIAVEDDLIKRGEFICNFGVVRGYFSCYDCKNLESLKGAPREVGRFFCCIGCNKLKSLEGAPEKVDGYFDCSECDNLESLKGAPKEVGGDFDCTVCKKLTSLEGAPEKVGKSFYCYDCPKLKDYNINTKVGGELIK